MSRPSGVDHRTARGANRPTADAAPIGPCTQRTHAHVSSSRGAAAVIAHRCALHLPLATLSLEIARANLPQRASAVRPLWSGPDTQCRGDRRIRTSSRIASAYRLLLCVRWRPPLVSPSCTSLEFQVSPASISHGVCSASIGASASRFSSDRFSAMCGLFCVLILHRMVSLCFPQRPPRVHLPPR